MLQDNVKGGIYENVRW